MFHCNGWGGVYALTGMGGTHVVLRAVGGDEIFRLIAEEGVTFACMAPAVLRTILDFEDKEAYEIRTRPRFVVAGAPPPAAFVERLERELGWEFTQIYGLQCVLGVPDVHATQVVGDLALDVHVPGVVLGDLGPPRPGPVGMIVVGGQPRFDGASHGDLHGAELTHPPVIEAHPLYHLTIYQ